MSRLILKSIGDVDDSVHLEPDPDLTVGRDELLVEMEAASINLTDFRIASGTYTDKVRLDLPAPMGSEGVGRVVEAGADVDRALVGRRVVILPTYEQGTWAERTVVPARSVVAVGDGGDPLQLAMLAVNPPTAHAMLNRYVDLRPGDWIGQDMANSAVGQYVIALARHAGVRTLNVVRREDTAQQLRALGADIVVVDGDNLRGRIADALGDTKLRMVFDGVGGPIAGDLAHSLEFGGQVVSYSSLTRTPVAVPAADLVYNELGVRGFWLINWLRSAPRSDVEATYGELAELVERAVLASSVEATYSLADHRAAFAHARRPQRSGKVLFAFAGNGR
jgi:NADPH:quinone reductase-like Zn-dependent oxidoreductase